MSSSTQISIRSPKNQPRRKTPPSFWDNLSRQVLVPRALKEFDRRTIKYHPPIPPQPSSLGSGRNYGDLKRFARLGGPSLADLRGYHRAVSSNSGDRSGSASPGNMTKTKLDGAFDVHFVDNRIFIENTEVEPENKDDIVGKLAKRRSELEESGLTKEKFKRFQDRNKVAFKDATMMSTVLPMITGEADTTTANGLSFSDLEDLTDGSLTKPVASCCDGLLPDEIDLQIRKDLGQYIVPSTKTIAPCLPNFFIEGVAKDWDVAKRRGCYCGTLGARGVHMLRSFIDPDTALDNKAYTIVATYYKAGILELYTIHPARFGDNGITYYMALLDKFFMDVNLDSFSKGVRALRNARDWAMEQRKKMADDANAKRRALLPAAN